MNQNNRNNQNNQNNQNNNTNRQPDYKRIPPKKKGTDYWFYGLLLVIVIGFVFFIQTFQGQTKDELKYNQFVLSLNEGRVKSIKFTPVGDGNDDLLYVEGVYLPTADGEEKEYSLIVSIYHLTPGSQIDSLIQEKGIPTVYASISRNIFQELLFSIISIVLPLILALGLVLFLFYKSNSAGNNKTLEFTKSRAKLSRDKTITFNDVAGCDEEKQELVEVIDFLKSPQKYIEIGARIPKGILLVGPPGTGKTLLAKAVAGEANVPFFSISGSDFVELYVGVGASRVRDLFKSAKENRPCIVFIDEIDAVGRQRNHVSAGMGGQEEREQTLNQLLVEMDGFGNNSGVIVIAATNRSDILDSALLRPGRFDRQITINSPDVIGREAILKVHARNKVISDNVHFDEIARRIPGFSGADIENLLNEAALLATRANHSSIEEADIDEAIDRVMLGPAKKTRKITDNERRRIAHHEAGHAVIGAKLENADIVQKVTIVPRGRAGGYALMIPEEEEYLKTKQNLLDRITGLLGGRAAEELIFNDSSTGAFNDFQVATKIARAMVASYGMSDLGTVQYEDDVPAVGYIIEKKFSDNMANEIDKRVSDIMEECHQRAYSVLKTNRELLERIAYYLLEIETLTKTQIYEIIETNHLKWWDDLKDQKAKEKEEANQQNTEETSSAQDPAK